MSRDSLILAHLEFTKGVTRKLLQALGPVLSLSEALSVAYLALVETAERYKDQEVRNFYALVTQRIRGAILDHFYRARDAHRKDPRGQRSVPKRHLDVLDPALVWRFVDATPSPFELIVQREREAWARDLSTRLSIQEQDVLKKRYRDELNDRQIGEQLGVTGTRVWQIARDALNKLRQEVIRDELSDAI